jgi:hypothetical protein
VCVGAARPKKRTFVIAITSLMRLARSIPMVLPGATDPVGVGWAPGAAGRQCHGLHRFRARDAGQVVGNLEADCARRRSRCADLQSGQSQFCSLPRIRDDVRAEMCDIFRQALPG